MQSRCHRGRDPVLCMMVGRCLCWLSGAVRLLAGMLVSSGYCLVVFMPAGWVPGTSVQLSVVLRSDDSFVF